MFVYNIKFNRSSIFKFFLAITCTILIVFFCISAYTIFNKSLQVNDELPKTDVININSDNYTNILKTVHDNLDSYVGKKVHFSGYIYRVSDFKDNQFVLARDMVISSNLQTLVVGFLCDCKDAKNFEDKAWVEVTGKIIKGNYKQEIPIIEISNIKKIDKPSDCLVYPPDENYVPTINLF